MTCIYGDNLVKKGECEKQRQCLISIDKKPVCGVNNITYSNMQELICNAMTLKHGGKCKKKEECPDDCFGRYKPVCGVNNFTYRNKC